LVTQPYSIKAGEHIKTDISGRLNVHESLKKSLKCSIPPPAVCGLPKTMLKLYHSKKSMTGVLHGLFGRIE
jgi:isochorismate synthase